MASYNSVLIDLNLAMAGITGDPLKISQAVSDAFRAIPALGHARVVHEAREAFNATPADSPARVEATKALNAALKALNDAAQNVPALKSQIKAKSEFARNVLKNAPKG